MTKKVIRLFENCIIVKGAGRSIIMDTPRKAYYLVPNSLADMFNENHILDIDSIENTEENNMVVNEYIDFLFSNELCFYCDETLVAQFPNAVITDWDYPAKITNAIVAFDGTNTIQGLKSIKELADNYQTRYVEIHLAKTFAPEDMAKLLNTIDQMDLNNYNVLIDLKHTSDLETVTDILKNHYKISRNMVYGAGINDIMFSDKGDWGTIFLLQDAFANNKCGVVDRNSFCNSIDHVTESLNHNTCLNRKLAIDKDGNIKNCMSMAASHGNINETPLSEIVHQESFQALWHVKKDEIAICRDCEFRHICTDCRAYIENPEDIYSKPLKCGYDPYTNEWQEWSTLPFKQKAIEFYGIKTNVNV